MLPYTDVILWQTPFDISNKYVVAMENGSDLIDTLNNLSYQSIEFKGCYWQRENVSFRCNANIDIIKQYNYCTYRNAIQTVACFITNFEYINDSMTLVHIVTDSWMTYQKNISFKDSPMIRCHPTMDEEKSTDVDKHINILQEPINTGVIPIVSVNDIYIQDKSNPDMMYLYLSQIDIDNLSAVNFSTYIQIYTDLQAYIHNFDLNIQPQIITDYFLWWDAMTTTYAKVGGKMQLPTYVTDDITDTHVTAIIKYLASCEMNNLLMGGYSIPKSLTFNTLDGYNGKKLDGRVENADKEVTYNIVLSRPTLNINADWNKIKISPQYNSVFYNFFGNVINLPFESFTKSDYSSLLNNRLTIKFNYNVNFAYDGYATIRPKIPGLQDLYSCVSPQWDNIPINYFVAETISSIPASANIVRNKVLNTLSAGLAGIMGGLNARQAFNSTLLPKYNTEYNPYLDMEYSVPNKKRRFVSVGDQESLASSIGDMSKNALRRSSNINGSENVFSDVITGSSITQNTSILNYLMSHDAGFTIFYATPSPSDVKRLNHFFSMYGYNQGGLVHSINPRQTDLNWVYYETSDANITGIDVPQVNIEDIRSMFNSGVFIFKPGSGLADFKNFDESALDSNHY